jgi:hypothetical protein
MNELVQNDTFTRRSFVFANVNVGTTRKTSMVRREIEDKTTLAGISLFNVE